MAEKRDVIKKVCLTESESKRVQEDALNMGMKFSEYIRFLTQNKPKEHPDVIMTFKGLINEINHIGININQIAMHCNSGIYTYEDKEQLFAHLRSINRKIKEVIDLYGN